MPVRRPSGVRLLAVLAAAAVAVPLLALPAQASSTANEVVYVETAPAGASTTSSVVLRRLDGSGTTRLTAQTLGVVDGAPELSQDGSRVAFASTRGGGPPAVQVVDRNGAGLERLTSPADGELDGYPTFTPDGREIVFARASGAGPADSRLFRVSAAGGAATPLGVPGTEPDVSPDGRTIAYSDGNGMLRTVPVGGGTSTGLGVAGQAPTWSPDGTQIAYIRATGPTADPQSRLHVYSVSGGTDRTLPIADAGGTVGIATVAWSPDGQSLVYTATTTSGTGTTSRLFAVDRLGARTSRVFAPRNDAVDQVAGNTQGPRPGSVTGAGTPSRYVPVDPQRIFDTRESEPAPGPKGRIGAAEARGIQVTGRAGVPADATAVVLNVTGIAPTADTYLVAYPTGSPVPDSSSINLRPGTDVPNLVTVKIGDDGKVTLRNNVGSIDAAADVSGYYVPVAGAPAASTGFTALSPVRIFDSRPGEPGSGPKGRLGPGATVDVAVAGVGEVPATATAVVVNLTGIGASGATFLTAYPTGSGAAPGTSNLNVPRATDVANVAVVPVGPDGRIRLRNDRAEIDVAVDVTGFYSPTGRGLFTPVNPARFLDTRDGTGGIPAKIGARDYVDVLLAGYRGIPGSATGVVGNLTAVAPSQATVLRAYPAEAGAEPPVISNLNLNGGDVRANAAYLIPGSTNLVRLQNDRGSLNALIDVAGYFTP